MPEDFLGFKSLDQFRDYLRSYVDIGPWGANGAKSPTELYQEILEGDSGLVRMEHGLLRLTWPIFIDVSYHNRGVHFKCFEAENKKGKHRDLPGTYAEKRHANESMDAAIRRTYEEEIEPSFHNSGLSLSNSSLDFEREWEENTGARSYPGLQTKSINTLFTLHVVQDQGTPKPFVLIEANGTSKFDWKVER
ncbi:MAG TPA: hypothetical protein VMR81_01390 [Patescibacteria group bacterium]|nr:hypothetical protein [Patescibacteria group bacterium]